MTSASLIEQWRRAAEAPFEGWDFSYLKGRFVEGEPPWDYLGLAKAAVRQAFDILDVATGGGEIFASLAPFPGRATAVEGYVPNLPSPGAGWRRWASPCFRPIPSPACRSMMGRST